VGLVLVGVLADHRELVVTAARDGLAVGHGRPEARSDPGQQPVTGVVPAGGVDHPEVVHVDHQEGGRVLGSGQGTRQSGEEPPAVRLVARTVLGRSLLEPPAVGAEEHELGRVRTRTGQHRPGRGHLDVGAVRVPQPEHRGPGRGAVSGRPQDVLQPFPGGGVQQFVRRDAGHLGQSPVRQPGERLPGVQHDAGQRAGEQRRRGRGRVPGRDRRICSVLCPRHVAAPVLGGEPARDCAPAVLQPVRGGGVRTRCTRASRLVRLH
jgi:hypothetical protein